MQSTIVPVADRDVWLSVHAAPLMHFPSAQWLPVEQSVSAVHESLQPPVVVASQA